MVFWSQEFGIFQPFADGLELISEEQLFTCKNAT